MSPRDQPDKSSKLPSDIATLQAMLLERDLLIEKLKLQIARMKRARFGASSEQLDGQILQLELIVEDLETSHSAVADHAATDKQTVLAAGGPLLAVQPPADPTPSDARARALPGHLPREIVRYEPQITVSAPNRCGCKHCGAKAAELTHLGDDQSELLEYVPGRFKVIVAVRPKYLCGQCNVISQASAPGRTLAKSYAGAGLLAHVLTSKYGDHLPLYRQSEIYAREGVELSRSTLADWVGASSMLLAPLVQALQRYVLDASKLHADDTPVPVLQPGRGSTKTARLWVYVRDDRAAPVNPNVVEPPAVWFAYSADRKGCHPQQHLRDYQGILQADGYAGYELLYASGEIIEAACWAHVRRKFFDIHKANASGATIAEQSLRRIASLYEIEQSIRGKPPDERRRRRGADTRPKLDELRRFFETTLGQVSKKSDLAEAIRYALVRWRALTRFVEDGRIEIDNNAAERALRCVALGRKNFLFAGSDQGGERAAAIYSLIQSAKLNGIDPQAYLRYVLTHINEHPVKHIGELLPWRVAGKLAATNGTATAADPIAA